MFFYILTLKAWVSLVYSFLNWKMSDMLTNIAYLKVYLPACQPKHISLLAATATVCPPLLRYSSNGQRGLKIPPPVICESTLNTKVTMEACLHETIQCHGNKSVWHHTNSNEIWEVMSKRCEISCSLRVKSGEESTLDHEIQPCWCHTNQPVLSGFTFTQIPENAIWWSDLLECWHNQYCDFPEPATKVEKHVCTHMHTWICVY